MAPQYQIYIIREDGRPSLEGHWGSEYAISDTREEAERDLAHLSAMYPDCEWVIQEVEEDEKDSDEALHREAREVLVELKRLRKELEAWEPPTK